MLPCRTLIGVQEDSAYRTPSSKAADKKKHSGSAFFYASRRPARNSLLAVEPSHPKSFVDFLFNYALPALGVTSYGGTHEAQKPQLCFSCHPRHDRTALCCS